MVNLWNKFGFVGLFVGEIGSHLDFVMVDNLLQI